jgi:hypothetical protein
MREHPMTRRELAIGSVTFLIVAVAGFFSTVAIERRYAAEPAQMPSTSVACVSEDGSWKNWVWANVPTLSPKCPPNR